MKTLTLNLISGGTVEVNVDDIKHVQVEAKGTTVVVQHDDEPPQSYHVYEAVSRLRSLMK